MIITGFIGPSNLTERLYFVRKKKEKGSFSFAAGTILLQRQREAKGTKSLWKRKVLHMIDIMVNTVPE